MIPVRSQWGRYNLPIFTHIYIWYSIWQTTTDGVKKAGTEVVTCCDKVVSVSSAMISNPCASEPDRKSSPQYLGISPSRYILWLDVTGLFHIISFAQIHYDFLRSSWNCASLRMTFYHLLGWYIQDRSAPLLDAWRPAKPVNFTCKVGPPPVSWCSYTPIF